MPQATYNLPKLKWTYKKASDKYIFVMEAGEKFWRNLERNNVGASKWEKTQMT